MPAIKASSLAITPDFFANTSTSHNRIASLDLLKGLVMVIMALDHIRDFFHSSAFIYDPGDPTQTSLPIFFTRWITHFCAPTFCFLAGISAFLVGKRRNKKELSMFLLKRGFWLVIIELTIVNFGWFFDFSFSNPVLMVIWSLGVSMIFLAGIIYLPRKLILALSCLLIFGHNLLDKVHFEGNVFWSILHDPSVIYHSDDTTMFVGYPLIPWIAVMSLGYSMGTLYNADFEAKKRRRLLNMIGISAILLFVVIRFFNIYGDSREFVAYSTFSQSLVSFLNPSKYPPSLSYLLMTLGTSFIFLANTENWKGRVVNFFSTFGRVPFFYYILHIYFIHLVAMIFAAYAGYGWDKMMLETFVTNSPDLKGYGYPLWIVYLVWAGIIALLYPLCRLFDRYKMKHKEKWWLSYL